MDIERLVNNKNRELIYANWIFIRDRLINSHPENVLMKSLIKYLRLIVYMQYKFSFNMLSRLDEDGKELLELFIETLSYYKPDELKIREFSKTRTFNELKILESIIKYRIFLIKSIPDEFYVNEDAKMVDTIEVLFLNSCLLLFEPGGFIE